MLPGFSSEENAYLRGGGGGHPGADAKNSRPYQSSDGITRRQRARRGVRWISFKILICRILHINDKAAPREGVSFSRRQIYIKSEFYFTSFTSGQFYINLTLDRVIYSDTLKIIILRISVLFIGSYIFNRAFP